MSEFNGISDQVQGLLVGAVKPKEPIDTKHAADDLNKFETEYHRLFECLTP
ncbi:hypothetical protein ACPOL_0309 [Acidisarcina polymorpha]|uniref:Uncharacterized protein n=1 Tax=Acidisarcina polymorpha TaxID=2211140 RepID=A0A2Z5FSB0_9BACT|nr:hypothetical protein ACPOL_0309 [Acidisarcina polymorpha]